MTKLYSNASPILAMILVSSTLMMTMMTTPVSAIDQGVPQFLRGGGGRGLEELEQCLEPISRSVTFKNVPGGRERSVSLDCPAGEILLDFFCDVGGNFRQLNPFPKIFSHEITETKLKEAVLDDGRRVATGVNCVMQNSKGTLSAPRDATLATFLLCGKAEEFPTVELAIKKEFKGKVPRKKVRSTTVTCPSGKVIFGNGWDCDNSNRGTFQLRDIDFPSAGSFTCLYKNQAASKRSGTIETYAICGQVEDLPEICQEEEEA